MDRACRIERTFLEILAADERVARQEMRIAELDGRGLHGAAACARETLMLMADRLLALTAQYEMMVNTAYLIEETQQAMARKPISD